MKVFLQFAVVAVLVLVNAGFAGSEMALISLREGQLRQLERRNATGRLLARLAREPNRFLATIQIGITLAGFLASATATVVLAEPLRSPLGFLGSAAEIVAIVIVTLALTFVTLVFGELAPKRIAMQRAEGWALLAARPLDMIARLARPAVWLLGHATNLVVRLTGADPNRQREEVTREELNDLVAVQAGFSPEQRSIISGAFEIGERTIREVLVPRRDVFSLEATAPVPEALLALAASGHFAAPVVESGELDTVVGVVHLRDLLGDEGLAASRVKPAMGLPESLSVVAALRRMQTDHEQVALVVDEHGGVGGIVTIEDLIEELVGEIYDETDNDLQNVVRLTDGSVLLPGSFPVHDLPDISIDIPDGNYTTVAGFILDRLGRIPEQPGDAVAIPGWRLEVAAVEGHAIHQVRCQREVPRR